jgi:hypothetical protein
MAAWTAMVLVSGANSSRRFEGSLDEAQPVTQLESFFMYSDSVSGAGFGVSEVWRAGERVCSWASERCRGLSSGRLKYSAKLSLHREAEGCEEAVRSVVWSVVSEGFPDCMRVTLLLTILARLWGG